MASCGRQQRGGPGARPLPYQNVPPLRADPLVQDDDDDARRVYVHGIWTAQDDLLRPYERSVEENIQMLLGRQWIAWVERLGRWVDLDRFMTPAERRWRQRPVVNRLLFWFMLVHARLTENPPIITFRPGPDRIDAMLAEVQDTIYKVLWNETGMQGKLDEAFSWLIPGGRVFFKSRVDPWQGDVRTWTGPAVLSMDSPDGPIERLLADDMGEPLEIPYDKEGQALVRSGPQGLEITGDPHTEYEGGIKVDVLSPLECRGEWGHNVPWHEKSWHIHRSYLTPERVYETYGIEVEAELTADDAEIGGELRRQLFGTGYFGQASTDRVEQRLGDGGRDKTGYVVVDELWQAPCRFPGMERTGSSPGGRLLTVTRRRVLRDGPRPADFNYTSPIQGLDFVRLPGRAGGSTPQEALNPLQRQYNRGYAQFQEHRNLSTNPIKIWDRVSGVTETEDVSQPGSSLWCNRRADKTPVLEFVTPPNLGVDSWRLQDQLLREMQDLGNIEGAEGRVPTKDASGELVKELRFNADRWIGPTLRRAPLTIARVAEDWMAIGRVLWDQQKILTYAGDDQIIRTVVVEPEMWKGKVNAVPDLESMLPESRQERQARLRIMFAGGELGSPADPRVQRAYLEMARFPHMARTAMPGGVDRVTAQQENGKLVLGSLATELPIFEWYDHLVHLESHEEFMKSPEYLKLKPEIQQEFVAHREMHILAMQIVAAKQIAQQQALAQAVGVPAAGGPESNGAAAPAPAAQATAA